MKVLIVDDEATIRQSVGSFLTACGHEIGSAANGVEALQSLEEAGAVDVILSDVRMPRMNGLDLLHTVRVRHPGTPVILMTGHGDEDVAAAALQEGAHNYLKKPVALRDLMACLDELDERRRLEAQVLSDFRTVRRGGRLDGAPAKTEEAALETGVLLIASADASCRAAIAQPLHSLGHQIHEARTAEDARQLFAERPVDVVIADVDLTDADGIEVGEELRAIDPTVVTVTIAPDHDQKTLLRALESGSSGYLTRPPDADQVCRLAGKVLAQRKRLVDARLLLSDLIEARSDLQARIAERERYLSHLIDSAPFGIVSTDRAGRILTVNGRAEDLQGTREAALKGEPLGALFADPGDRRGFLPSNTACRRELQRPDGTRVPVLLHTSDVLDSQRQVIAHLHVVEDLTEREHVESQLLQAERLSVLGQMAPRIAHEFKTPLQVILGNTELTLETIGDVEHAGCRRLMEGIAGAVGQMDGLVQQMLDLGKPKRSRVEPVDLASEATDILDRLGTLRVLQNCRVLTDFGDDLPQILGDPSQIEQVLRNLIVNAAQAMERSQRRDLGISLRRDGPHVVLTVGDTGCGIEAAQRECVFQPFYTTKPEGKGTGLGLSIVKTILDRHAAALHMDSKPGEGTVFTISFPTAGAAEGDLR